MIFKSHRFTAEVAVAPGEQQRGLMYRQSLAKDRCMFFFYEQDAKHSIWMKNCFISLDVVWMDADGKVVGFEQNVPPCSPLLGDGCPTYGEEYLARHLVEFLSGTIKRIGLKKGDRLGWDLELNNGRKIRGGAWTFKKK